MAVLGSGSGDSTPPGSTDPIPGFSGSRIGFSWVAVLGSGSEIRSTPGSTDSTRVSVGPESGFRGWAVLGSGSGNSTHSWLDGFDPGFRGSQNRVFVGGRFGVWISRFDPRLARRIRSRFRGSQNRFFVRGGFCWIWRFDHSRLDGMSDRAQKPKTRFPGSTSIFRSWRPVRGLLVKPNSSGSKNMLFSALQTCSLIRDLLGKLSRKKKWTSFF